MSPSIALWKSERVYFHVGCRSSSDGAMERGVPLVAGDGQDILFAVRALVAHRRHGGVIVQRCAPQFLAGLAVEGAEAGVAGGADEHEPACGGDRAALVER